MSLFGLPNLVKWFSPIRVGPTGVAYISHLALTCGGDLFAAVCAEAKMFQLACLLVADFPGTLAFVSLHWDLWLTEQPTLFSVDTSPLSQFSIQHLATHLKCQTGTLKPLTCVELLSVSVYQVSIYFCYVTVMEYMRHDPKIQNTASLCSNKNVSNNI